VQGSEKKSQDALSLESPLLSCNCFEHSDWAARNRPNSLRKVA
jgi:hypothetical protein